MSAKIGLLAHMPPISTDIDASAISRCQGRWRTILSEVGIPASALTGKNGPCPICGGKDRFRFDDKETGRLWLVALHSVRKRLWDAPGYEDQWLVLERSGRRLDEIEVRACRRRFRPNIDTAHGNSLGDVRSRSKERTNGSRPRPMMQADGTWLVGISCCKLIRRGSLSATAYLYENGEFVGRFPAMLSVVITRATIAGLHRTF